MAIQAGGEACKPPAPLPWSSRRASHCPAQGLAWKPGADSQSAVGTLLPPSSTACTPTPLKLGRVEPGLGGGAGGLICERRNFLDWVTGPESVLSAAGPHSYN